MKTAAVNRLTFSDNGARIDASFHLSEGITVKRTVKQSPYPLINVWNASKEIFFGNRAKRVYVQKREKGIPFLSSSEILEVDTENIKLASKKYTPCIEQLRIEEGWILISRSGTIGNTAWSNKTHAQKLASEHVIRIIPNDILRGGYLYAYLSSKQGHSLLTQGTFGGVIQHIEPDFVASIPVPKMPIKFQDKVNELINRAAELRSQSANSLQSAIRVFESHIGQSSYSPKYQTHSVSFKAIHNNHIRFDSQYQIGREELSKEICNETVKISQVAKEIYVGNRGKRYYVNDGIPFLSSSDMMLFNPVKYSIPISRKTPNLDGLLVHTDDILISRSGTIGNTVIVGNTLNNIAVSEHALRLVIDKDKMDPKYVFCYFKTLQGKRLLESLAYGSVIITLGEEFVGDIDLPVLPIESQNVISDHISRYVNQLDQATSCENEAISLVEAEINKWNN